MATHPTPRPDPLEQFPRLARYLVVGRKGILLAQTRGWGPQLRGREGKAKGRPVGAFLPHCARGGVPSTVRIFHYSTVDGTPPVASRLVVRSNFLESRFWILQLICCLLTLDRLLRCAALPLPASFSRGGGRYANRESLSYKLRGGLSDLKTVKIRDARLHHL